MVQIGNKGLFATTRNPQLFDDLFRQYSKPLFYYAAKFVDDEAARDLDFSTKVQIFNHIGRAHV